MQIATQTNRPAYFSGFEKLINHIIFGQTEFPQNTLDGEYPIRKGLMNFVRKGYTLLETKLMYEMHMPTFEKAVDTFLNEATQPIEITLKKCYEEHPCKDSFDLFTEDTLYHSDLIRYKKFDNGKALQIQYINEAENAIDILAFHILHLLDLVSLISADKKSLSCDEYEAILNHYQDLLHRQQIIFEISAFES